MGIKQNRYAMEHGAHYSLERSKSIYYPDNSDNLEICLLFRAYKEAYDFSNFLSLWYINNPISVKIGDVSIQGQEHVNVVESDLHRVQLIHYDASDSESPVVSLEELAVAPSSISLASAFSLTNPVAKLQSIERPDLFNTLRPERAHIKSVKDCREADTDYDTKLIKDDNNLLALSSHFHQYFDGKNTIDGYLEAIPLIAIKPLQCDNVRTESCPDYPLLKLQRLDLAVECRNQEVGRIVKDRLKMGTKTVCHTTYETHILVENASITSACLDFKYKQTQELWNAHDETDL